MWGSAVACWQAAPLVQWQLLWLNQQMWLRCVFRLRLALEQLTNATMALWMPTEPSQRRRGFVVYGRVSPLAFTTSMAYLLILSATKIVTFYLAGTGPNITRNAIVNCTELVTYDLIKDALLRNTPLTGKPLLNNTSLGRYY